LYSESRLNWAWLSVLMVLWYFMRIIRPCIYYVSRVTKVCAIMLAAMPWLAQAQRPIASPGLVPEDMRQPEPQAPVSMGSSTVAITTSMEVLNDIVKLGTGDRLSYRIVEEKREPILL